MEKIIFLMDWWTTYYQCGLRRQQSITPGNILVELKTRADAKAAAGMVTKEGMANSKKGSTTKKSKRQHAESQKGKLSAEEVQQRAAVTRQALGLEKRVGTSERDQLDGTATKRLRGGGDAGTHDPVVEDPRYISMQQHLGDLQSMVTQLLDAKV